MLFSCGQLRGNYINVQSVESDCLKQIRMEDSRRILNNKINSLVKIGETAQVEFKSARGGFPGHS